MAVKELGKADWIYDEEYDMHIPCCTKRRVKLLASGGDVVEKCGNGPLNDPEIASGICGSCRTGKPRNYPYG